MLGYSTPGSRSTSTARPGNGNDYAIADLFAQAVGAYGINLVPQIVDDGLSFSDHSPFWNYGYPALLAIEDWNDHTPYYHTTNDQLENLNLPYYTDAVKAALATFAPWAAWS
jgi:Zn-dependent M28 family amino/carboxypeptidase